MARRSCVECLEKDVTIEQPGAPLAAFCSNECRLAFHATGTATARPPLQGGVVLDIEAETLANTHFRRVVHTDPGRMQLVLMAITPEDAEIGLEEHRETQFFRVEAGQGRALIGGATVALYPGVALVVAGGVSHNIQNTSKAHALKLYTIYVPPHHADRHVDARRPSESDDL